MCSYMHLCMCARMLPIIKYYSSCSGLRWSWSGFLGSFCIRIVISVFFFRRWPLGLSASKWWSSILIVFIFTVCVFFWFFKFFRRRKLSASGEGKCPESRSWWQLSFYLKKIRKKKICYSQKFSHFAFIELFFTPLGTR